jgi:hypothetical protein
VGQYQCKAAREHVIQVHTGNLPRPTQQRQTNRVTIP